MERLTIQEWNALTAEEQKQREAEMPWEVLSEKSKAEQERLVNLNIEKDRKLKAALSQVEELDKRIKDLEASGAPQGQINNLEAIKKQFQEEYDRDPAMAIARLSAQGTQYALNQIRQNESIKKQALRKIRKEYAKDYDKFGDALEDKLDAITGAITVDDVLVMFNSLRGSSIDEQLENARKEGAKKALEEAGVVAIDGGGSSTNEDGSASTLTKEQKDEMQRMMLSEKDYKEILRDRQNVDRLEGRTPRTLISPKH